jgi:hypothetical protein
MQFHWSFSKRRAPPKNTKRTIYQSVSATSESVYFVNFLNTAETKRSPMTASNNANCDIIVLRCGDARTYISSMEHCFINGEDTPAPNETTRATENLQRVLPKWFH